MRYIYNVTLLQSSKDQGHNDNWIDSFKFVFNRYYEDDPYDRRSIQRSLSQPSLARSAGEITEQHWIIRDDLSEDSDSPRNTSRMVSEFSFSHSTSRFNFNQHNRSIKLIPNNL